MKRMIAIVTLSVLALAVGGTAVAGEQADESHARAKLENRKVVWVTPSETPYALTGKSSQPTPDSEPKSRNFGRSGYALR